MRSREVPEGRNSRKARWLLLLDLDGTVWDCRDISSLSPPFERIDQYTFRDSRGFSVRVYGDVVALMKWARAHGAVVAALSWNVREIAVEALDASGLLELMDYQAIEYHPRKDLMALKLFEELKRRGLGHVLECIVYVDDSEAFLGQVSKAFDKVCAIRAWADFKDLESLAERVCTCLARCGFGCDGEKPRAYSAR
ncbi:MAG: magnesium-dependent phosphatase-1 [Desulfurococcaceae archaeon]